MKAVVSERYGPPDVAILREIAKPVPGAGDVLIRVHATTVSRTDCGMRDGHPWFMRLASGLLRPKITILGMDFAGTVEKVGSATTEFTPGQRVFGLSPDRYGAHAEYICLPDSMPITAIPNGIGFTEAVLCEGAWYADTYLRAFKLGANHSILIYGASGAIGTAAVQLAKAYGATVTAVVGTRHIALAQSLGADRVIDYTAEDFTKNTERYDFILDAVGKTTFGTCRSLLKPKGVFSATDLGPWGQNVYFSIWSSVAGSGRMIFPMPKANKSIVERFAGLMREGKLRAVLDRSYRLDQIVEAYRYVETAQKTGIVPIIVSTNSANP